MFEQPPTGAPSLMTCASCGAALSASDRFCPQCGLRTGSTPAPGATTGLAPSDPWTAIVGRLREATRGEFEILRELGRGGMAAVYLAHELALNRKVALKVMAPSLLTGEGMVERFRQEAVTVANMSHAHIVTIYAVRQFDDLHFFTMKFVEGRSLDHVVHAHGALPIPIVRALLFMVGSALGYAHRRGVVHRDVKPANVLLDSEGTAMVTDFGIAKVAQEVGNTQHLTQTGTLIGTPTYISPEQCYAQPVSAASDQYSLGIVAYELLTGHPPFTGSTFMVMHAHTERPVPPLRESRPDCPEELEAAVMRMLEKDPSRRWPSLQHALAALDARPLAEHDPMRDELARLATEGGTGPAAILTPPAAETPRATDVLPPPPPPYVVSVAILAPPDAIEVGDTISLGATARSSSGSTMPGTRIRWSADAGDVATVDETRGVVQALAPGTVTITAEAEGVEGTVTVRVVPRRVAEVNVSIPPGTLHAGDRVQLSATALDRRHEPLLQPITWMSATPEIADFGSDGILVARKPGTVLVWAEAEGVRGSAQLEIAPPPVASLRFVDAPSALEADESASLVIQALDAGGTELMDRTATWSTSDRAVAVVDARGRLETKRAGTVHVRCSSEGVVAEHQLTVLPQSVREVRVDPPAGRVRPGRRVKLTAHVLGRRGQELERPVEWYTTAPEVATVGADGVATLHAPGEATILAVADGGQGVLPLTVPAPTPEELARAERARRMRRASIIGVPSLAAAAGVVWLATALVRGGGESATADTGVGIAQAGVTAGATLSAISGGTTSAEPPVPPRATVARLAITPPGEVRVGDTLRLAAEAFDGSGARLDGEPPRWSGSANAIGDVRADGRLIARAPGTLAITASSGDVSARIAVVVAPRPATPAAATVAPLQIVAPPRLQVGARATLRARGGDPASELRWSSGNPAVLRVDPRTGAATAVGAGEVVVIAQRGATQASVNAFVVAAPTVIDSVALRIERAQLRVGEATSAVATAWAGNAAQGERAVRWSVAPADVLAIDEYGSIVARRPGTATITAAVGGRSASRTVVVSASVAAAPTPPATPERRPASEGAPTAEQARDAIDAFVTAVTARDVDAVARLYLVESAQDRRELDWLLTQLRRRESRFTLGAPEAARPPQGGDAPSAEYAMRCTWTTPVGRRKSPVRTFEVRFGWSNGAWRPTGVRVVGRFDD